jgi:hypothetical protein
MIITYLLLFYMAWATINAKDTLINIIIYISSAVTVTTQRYPNTIGVTTLLSGTHPTPPNHQHHPPKRTCKLPANLPNKKITPFK